MIEKYQTNRSGLSISGSSSTSTKNSKEAITAIDINFSTSDSAHQVSISSSVVNENFSSKNLGTISGGIGQSPTISNEKIKSFLSGFVLAEETTTKDAIGIKKTRRYIDSLSMILDSWVILVRGISCSPTTSLSYSGRIFASSQLPNYFFEVTPNFANVMGSSVFGNTTTVNSTEKYIVLGKTYSTISTMSPPKIQKVNPSAANSLTFIGKDKIYLVYQNKEFKSNLSTGTPDYGLTFDSSQLKYGYTAKEFFDALGSAGIKISGPFVEKQDVLFETSGTIRACLSAIMSYYGYYWYIGKNPSNAWYIQIITSSTLQSLQIPDPTLSTNANIISASFTNGGRSTRTITSFIGTTNPEKLPEVQMSYKRQATKTQFKLVDCSKAFDVESSKYGLKNDVFGPFYTFFCSDAASQSEGFDKLVYFASHKYTSFISSASKAYDDQPEEKNVEKKFVDIVNASEIKEKTYDLNQVNLGSGDIFYSLESSVNSGQTMLTPTETPLYLILSAYFKYYNSIYISRGYTENKAKNVSFSNNVSGPYDADDYISVVPELSDLVNFFRFAGMEIPQIKDFADNADVRTSDKYFIHLKENLIKGQDEDDKIEIPDFEFLNDIAIFYGKYDLGYLGIKKGTQEDISEAFDQSKQMFERFAKTLQRRKGSLTIAQVLSDDQDSDEGGQQQTEEPDFDLMSYSTKIPKINSSMLKSEIKVLNGDFKEIEALKGFYQQFDVNYQLKSSSVTYYSLEIPSFDISLDSISINMSADGITTTISRSNKSILPPDNALIISKALAQNTHRDSFSMSAGKKNFLGIN